MPNTDTAPAVAAEPRSPLGTRERQPAVLARGLSKRHGERLVVDQVDIELPTGVVSGFVGPNGAGKTTTIQMLLGLMPRRAAPPKCWGIRSAARQPIWRRRAMAAGVTLRAPQSTRASLEEAFFSITEQPARDS